MPEPQRAVVPVPPSPQAAPAPTPTPVYFAPAPAGAAAEGGYFDSERSAADGPPISHYLWVLRRHLWAILIFVGACTVATFVVSARLTPIYEATASIDIDRLAPSGVLGQESNRMVMNDSDQFIATQVKLVQSDAVLRPVVEKYHLLDQEGQTAKLDAVKAQNAARAPVKLRLLNVTRPPNTYLLQISYRSPKPELASDVANAIATSYLEHTYKIRITSSSSLALFMEKQIDELKAKMERSGEALTQFERELGVINPDEKTNILSARLLQLNTEYTNAQADRVRKESSYNSIKAGSVAAAQVSNQGEALAKLTERLNDARQRFAQVKTTHGSNHPDYKKAASEMAELEKQLEDARVNIAERIETDYKQALNREQMIQKTLAETKLEADKINARSFEYRQLKQEAEADKKLYEELLQKIKESGINAGFQNNNIRIADLARPGDKPVFPNIPLNVGLGLLCSAILAMGASILHDSLDTTVRDPEVTSRYLGTDVIGVLPAVRNASHLARFALPGQSEASAALATTQLEQATKNGKYHPKGYYRTISGFGEAIRTLRNTILLADLDNRPRSILITSANPSEGKSTAASHFAISHADQGNKTLLVDGDLRRPSIHRKFGLSADAGLSTVLTGQSDWRTAVQAVPGKPNLSILPSGPPSHRAADLVGRRMGNLLDEFVNDYDLVILDAPPLLGFAEPLQMAAVADGVLIISKAGQTKRKAVASVLSALSRVRANVIGLVLNQVKHDSSAGYSYYGYYHYGYYSPRKNDA